MYNFKMTNHCCCRTASVALFIKPLYNRLNIFFGSHRNVCGCVFGGGAVVAIEKYKMKFPLYFSRILFDSIRMHFNNAITLFIDGCQTTKQVHDFTVAVAVVARTPFRHFVEPVVYTYECVHFLGRFLGNRRRAHTFSLVLSILVYVHRQNWI